MFLDFKKLGKDMRVKMFLRTFVTDACSYRVALGNPMNVCYVGLHHKRACFVQRCSCQQITLIPK